MRDPPGCRRRRIETGDGRHAMVLDGGTGPAVVLLASPLVLASSYRSTLAHLIADFHVFVVELPGSGHASPLPQPWSMQQYADWLPGLFDALELPQPIVIGHSNSAAIALLLAADHPSRVSQLVLADGTGFDRAGSLARVIGARALDCLIEWRLTLAATHHVFFNVFAHWRNFWRQVWLSKTSALHEVAPRVTTPTLIAWGRHDHTYPLRCAEWARQCIPNSQLYICERGSHDWIVDTPAEFAGMMSRHVKSAQ